MKKTIKLKIGLCVIFIGSVHASPHYKIGFWSTWKIPCGIAMYTEHLCDALKNKSIPVVVYPNNLRGSELLTRLIEDKISLLNIQYDWSILPSTSELVAFLRKVRRLGIKIVVTVHAENDDVAVIRKYVNGLIYHKSPTISKDLKNIFILPLPIPVFEPKITKLGAREKYGFAHNDIILVTTGFLLEHKEFDKNLQALVPFLKKDPRHKIQIIAPITPRAPERCAVELNKLNKVLNDFDLKKQVKVITSFVSQTELSERIWLSDLGYQWFNVDTRATSAAAKEFIAARVPVVLPNSSHYHDVKRGVLKTEFNRDAFIRQIVHIISNKGLLDSLQRESEDEYLKKNYDSAINSFIEVYEKYILMPKRKRTTK